MCENGYEGPLCGVCSLGYYKQLQACKHCPSKEWIVGQLSIIAAIIIVIVMLAWTSKRKTSKGEGVSLIDTSLSKLKTVIGFYQVTYGLLETFSYVKWPGSLEVIGEYSEILQMNVLQVAPVHCLLPGVQANAFGNLFAVMTINAAVFGVSIITYGVKKPIILGNKSLDKDEKAKMLSRTKQLVYRNLFFFLYVTYLNTCSKRASVLPLACRKICQYKKEELCIKYLKADYSVECHGVQYNQWLIAAYISAAYVIVLPSAAFVVLWRKRK